MSYNDQNQPYEDPYAGYQEQDPNASQGQAEGYTGYEQQNYANQGYDNSGYQQQAAPNQRQRPVLHQLQRIQSGIPGFDQIVVAALIRDRVYLLAGPAGAGRQFLPSHSVNTG